MRVPFSLFSPWLSRNTYTHVELKKENKIYFICPSSILVFEYQFFDHVPIWLCFCGGGDKTAFYFFTFGCYYTVKLDYKLERNADSCSVFAGFTVAPFLLYRAGASVVLLMWTFTFLNREPNSIRPVKTNMTGSVYSVNVCIQVLLISM